MANPHAELLEIILRECAAAQPRPWYPAEYSKSTGVPREPLDACLDQLRLAGLVKLTPWVQGHGQGYQVTPQGTQVLEQPRLLDRLRVGQVPQPRPEPVRPAEDRHALAGMRGEMVREALLDDSRPLITQALLGLNILWFFVGFLVFNLRYGGTAGDYFSFDMGGQRGGGDKLFLTDIDTGSLFIVNVLDGNEWWRLLSYGFLHGGILHLGMNMYALYVLGPLLEKMWGRSAFLAIYLASCVGGGAAALVFSPRANLVGASGAICGLLGSMATWVFLNRHYLPPHIVNAWRNNLVQNVVLIAIISFMPGVSLAGHAGGFLAGAIVAAPLCTARFGSGPRRFLGWLGMAAILAVGLCLMVPPLQKFSKTDLMARLRAEEAQLRQLGERTGHANGAADDLAARNRKNLLAKANLDLVEKLLLNADETADEIRNGVRIIVVQAMPDALDIAKTADLQKQFQQQQARLQGYMIDLQKTASSAPPEYQEVIGTGMKWFMRTVQVSGLAAKVCDAGRRVTEENRKALQAEYERLTALRADFKAACKKVGL